MSGALVPPGGHLLTERSHFQPPRGLRGKMHNSRVKSHLPCGQELERKWATEGVLLGCQGHGGIYVAWDFQSQFYDGVSFLSVDCNGAFLWGSRTYSLEGQEQRGEVSNAEL